MLWPGSHLPQNMQTRLFNKAFFFFLKCYLQNYLIKVSQDEWASRCIFCFCFCFLILLHFTSKGKGLKEEEIQGSMGAVLRGERWCQSQGGKEHSGKVLSLEQGRVILTSPPPRRGHNNTVRPTRDLLEAKDSRNRDWKRMGGSWIVELPSLKIHFCLRGEFLSIGFQMHPSMKNRNMCIILRLIYEPGGRGVEISKPSIVV